MRLQLQLPPEIEAKLAEQAARTGRNVESLALEALQETLSNEPPSVPLLPPGEWLVEFEAWVNRHRSRNPHVDDSRDSNNPDRW